MTDISYQTTQLLAAVFSVVLFVFVVMVLLNRIATAIHKGIIE